MAINSLNPLNVKFFIGTDEDTTIFYAVVEQIVGESPLDFNSALIDLSLKIKTEYESE